MGRGTRVGQVCQCTGAFWRRALGEQLALSRGPTEGAGEKLSPCTSFTVSTWHHIERGGEEKRKSADGVVSEDAIWQRFRWQNATRERSRATERSGNNDATILKDKGLGHTYVWQLNLRKEKRQTISSLEVLKKLKSNYCSHMYSGQSSLMHQ